MSNGARLNPVVSSRESLNDPDVIYDIPKSATIDQPPPKCTGDKTVHKYINASSKVVRCSGECLENADDAFVSESQSDLSEAFPNQSRYYEETASADSGSPRRSSVDAIAPARPPKPRNLSETTTLDGMTASFFSQLHVLIDLLDIYILLSMKFRRNFGIEIPET